MKIEKETLEKIVRSAKGPPPPDWTYLPASVSLLVFGERSSRILAILKADRDGYVWRNQIALPGGRIDEKDPDALHAAKRELAEELSIVPENVEYFGSLGHFQTLQDTVIEVFVGIWNQRESIRFDTREIAKVLEIPVSELVRTHMIKGLNGRLPGMDELLYPVEDRVVWGVTAKILHFFIEQLQPELAPSLRSETG